MIPIRKVITYVCVLFAQLCLSLFQLLTTGSQPASLQNENDLYLLSYRDTAKINHLQEIFRTQGSNLGSPALWADSLPLSHPGSHIPWRWAFNWFSNPRLASVTISWVKGKFTVFRTKICFLTDNLPIIKAWFVGITTNDRVVNLTECVPEKTRIVFNKEMRISN